MPASLWGGPEVDGLRWPDALDSSAQAGFVCWLPSCSVRFLTRGLWNRSSEGITVFLRRVDVSRTLCQNLPRAMEESQVMWNSQTGSN